MLQSIITGGDFKQDNKKDMSENGEPRGVPRNELA